MQTTLDRGVKKTSGKLEGKRIALAVSGGIGAVESVKIIREIRRRGANVTAFMTVDALKFITSLSLEWASEQKVVLDDSPGVEHLDPFDMVVVAPATLNTISKASLGIADNAVLLLIASQLGRKGGLLFVPTMNEQLFHHPGYESAIGKLKSWGVEVYPSPREEDRLKMPDPILLADAVEKAVLSK